MKFKCKSGSQNGPRQIFLEPNSFTVNRIQTDNSCGSRISVHAHLVKCPFYTSLRRWFCRHAIGCSSLHTHECSAGNRIQTDNSSNSSLFRKMSFLWWPSARCRRCCCCLCPASLATLYFSGCAYFFVLQKMEISLIIRQALFPLQDGVSCPNFQQRF